MKKNQMKFLPYATFIALLAFGCAASEYSEPGNVTKTGVDTTAGVYFDSSKLLQSSFPTPTTFGGCTTAADNNKNILVSSSQVLSINIQSITASASPGSSGVQCGEAQSVAFLPNAGDNVWKSVLTGTVTIGTSNIGNQSVTFQRAFSADLDKDGSSDVVSYNVTLSGAGAVLISRTVRLTGVASCTTSRTAACAAATTTSSNTNVAAAALATAGDHTFSITWQTQTGTNNAGGAATVVIDGTTIVNGTSAGLENPGANLAAGPAEPATTGIFVSNTAAATWAVLNASAVPVNAMNIVMKGGTGAAGAQTAASNPTLKNVKWSKS